MEVRANGIAIDDQAIAREHAPLGGDPGLEGGAARVAAARALLLARARALGLETGRGDEATIEALLDKEAPVPEPTEQECRRYYDGHPERFNSGELAEVRHVLFAVTPGMPIDALRRTAENTLHELRERPEEFANVARKFSNCPSGAHGGNLGQIGRGECVPEFERAVFEKPTVGVLPRIVNTRYGFHVVLVERRIAGTRVPFEAVKDRIAAHLAGMVCARALVQYVRLLAAESDVRGVDLAPAASPLVQ